MRCTRNCILFGISLLLCLSCNNKGNGSKQPFSYPDASRIELMAEFDSLLENTSRKAVFSNWTLNKEGELQVDPMQKEAMLDMYNHQLRLDSREETTLLNAILVNKIRVNGKLFSGILTALDSTGESRLKACLYNGRLVYKLLLIDGNELHTEYFRIPELVDITLVRKPVIYLYDTDSSQQYDISLGFDGSFLAVYPPFNREKGWRCSSNINGQITIEDKNYPYLFWEGNKALSFELDSAFVVARADLIPFLESSLTLLGLNDRERADFITYWLPELNTSAYNLIHFAGSAYAKQVPIQVHPSPASLLRIFMVFRGLFSPIDLPQQKLKAARRSKNCLVEWGGLNIGNKALAF